MGLDSKAADVAFSVLAAAFLGLLVAELLWAIGFALQALRG